MSYKLVGAFKLDIAGVFDFQLFYNEKINHSNMSLTEKVYNYKLSILPGLANVSKNISEKITQVCNRTITVSKLY